MEETASKSWLVVCRINGSPIGIVTDKWGGQIPTPEELVEYIETQWRNGIAKVENVGWVSTCPADGYPYYI